MVLYDVRYPLPVNTPTPIQVGPFTTFTTTVTGGVPRALATRGGALVLSGTGLAEVRPPKVAGVVANSVKSRPILCRVTGKFPCARQGIGAGRDGPR